MGKRPITAILLAVSIVGTAIWNTALSLARDAVTSWTNGAIAAHLGVTSPSTQQAVEWAVMFGPPAAIIAAVFALGVAWSRARDKPLLAASGPPTATQDPFQVAKTFFDHKACQAEGLHQRGDLDNKLVFQWRDAVAGGLRVTLGDGARKEFMAAVDTVPHTFYPSIEGARSMLRAYKSKLEAVTATFGSRDLPSGFTSSELERFR